MHLRKQTQIHSHAHTHTHTRTCTNTNTHGPKCTHMHSHSHTYTHTHTHTVIIALSLLGYDATSFAHLDLGIFSSADSLKLCHVVWGLLMDSHFQVCPELFDWVRSGLYDVYMMLRI